MRGLIALQNMGQNNSREASDQLTQIERKAKIIAEAVRGTEPTPYLRDPPPLTTHTTTQPQRLWDAILRSQGRDQLKLALERFLQHEETDLALLLTFVADANDEEPAVIRSRLDLRYLDEGGSLQKMKQAQQALVLANMLLDEMDLPGNRFGTALHMWQKIVDSVTETNPLDRERADSISPRIIKFLRYHGLRRLVECLQQRHNTEAGVLEALTDIVDTDSQTREMILYQPGPRERPDHHKLVAANVSSWLIGARKLSFPRAKKGFTSSQEPWAALSTEIAPSTGNQSFGSIVNAINCVPASWDIAYKRCLRHVGIFGVEDLIKEFLQSMTDADRSVWMEAISDDWIERGKRHDPVKRLAAVIADALTAAQRSTRGIETIWYPLPRRQGEASSIPRGPIRVPSVKENTQNPANQTGGTQTQPPGTSNLELPPVQVGVLDDADSLYRVTPPRKSSQSKPKPGPAPVTSDAERARYRSLEAENTTLVVTQAELEETISYLMDDIAELQDQLEEDTRKRKPRYCRICGQHLVDEEAERLHMKKHRDELNKCREKNGLSPYGVDLSSPSSKGRRSKSSSPKSSSPSDGLTRKKKPKRLKESISKAGESPGPLGESSIPPSDPVGLGITMEDPPSRTDHPLEANVAPITSPDPLAEDAPPARPKTPGRRPSKGSNSPPNRLSTNQSSTEGVDKSPNPKRGRGSSSQASRGVSKQRSSSKASNLAKRTPIRTRSVSEASRAASLSKSPSPGPSKHKSKKRTREEVDVPSPIPEADGDEDGDDLAGQEPRTAGRSRSSESPSRNSQLGQFLEHNRISPEEANKNKRRRR